MQSTSSSSATATPPTRASTSPTMPFGAHKGMRLDQIPVDYLLWVACLDDLRQPLLGHVLREMGRRIVEMDQQAAPEREAVGK